MEVQILDPSTLLLKAKYTIKSIYSKRSDQSISELKNILKQVNLSKKTIPNPQLHQSQYYEIQVIAHNNLACVCLQKGKFKESLYHLEIVTMLQNQKYQDIVQIQKIDVQQLLSLATTCSNLCAVSSKIQDHKKALEKIQIAIKFLQNALKDQRYSQYPLNKKKAIQEEVFNSLIFAYYNCSIQYQYLSNLTQSHNVSTLALQKIKKWTQQGLQVKNNQIEGSFKQNIRRLQNKMKQRQRKISNYIRTWRNGIGTYRKTNEDQSIIFANQIYNLRNNEIYINDNNKIGIDGSSSAQISLKLRKNLDLDNKNKFSMQKKLYSQEKFYSKFYNSSYQFPKFNSKDQQIIIQSKTQKIRPKQYDAQQINDIIKRRKSHSQQISRAQAHLKYKRNHSYKKQLVQAEKIILDL